MKSSPKAEKLVASPNYSLALAADGASFVMGEVEPYAQFWLSERERLLFALFARKGGLGVEAAVAAMLALKADAEPGAERRRIERAIAGMRDAGVLIAPGGELSRYGKAMAHDYLMHRPFPAAIAAQIVQNGGIGPESQVLDLAAGPGSLALELARHTPHVAIMELSRGFCTEAKAEAARRGLALAAINESCNRLPQLAGCYNAITISQALHWLDDIAVCKGVCRTLAAGGSFFVVHAMLSLPGSHPLSYILGDRTPLGDRNLAPFAEQVRPLYRRLGLLFEALDAPDVDRHDPLHARTGQARIAGQGISLYRQQRPIDEGFARAFLSDSHIAALGVDREAFWQDLRARCAAAAPADLIGTQDWAVLHFRRGAEGFSAADWQPPAAAEIGYP